MKSATVINLDSKLKGYKPSKQAIAKFRKWHVESLLNQAADILDRCLKERSEYLSLKTKWDLLLLEREGDILSLALTDRKIKDGLLDIERKSLNSEIKKRNSLKKTHNEIVSYLKKWNVPNKNAPASYGYAVIRQAIVASELNTMESSVKSLKKNWEANKKSHYIESHKNSKKLRADKDLLMNSGSLNYTIQYKALQKRILRDYFDAYDRLVVAEQGLDEIYGFFESPNNERLPPNDPAASPYSLIDTMVIWARDAIRWLAAFGQLDQGWTACFSLRELVPANEWTKLESSKNSTEAFTFRLPKAHFDSHLYARIRGISMFAYDTSKDQRPWSATLKTPERTQIRQFSNSKVVDRELDQRDLPPCVLGRIETRDAPRAPEIAGMVSLMNASPVGIGGSDSGKWHLTISAPPEKHFNALRDIELELQLVGRPI